MTKREKEIIDGVVEILKDHLDPSRIILFGSRAKQTHHMASDFDFAVDMKKPGISIQREINSKIEEASGLYAVDIVYLRSIEDEFRRLIVKTGRVIYERRD